MVLNTNPKAFLTMFDVEDEREEILAENQVTQRNESVPGCLGVFTSADKFQKPELDAP